MSKGFVPKSFKFIPDLEYKVKCPIFYAQGSWKRCCSQSCLLFSGTCLKFPSMFLSFTRSHWTKAGQYQCMAATTELLKPAQFQCYTQPRRTVSCQHHSCRSFTFRIWEFFFFKTTMWMHERKRGTEQHSCSFSEQSHYRTLGAAACNEAFPKYMK